MAVSLATACSEAGAEVLKTPAPAAPIIVTTNAPPGLVATPLPAPATINVATSQPTRVEMPSAYGLGNYYAPPTPAEDAQTTEFNPALALPTAPPSPANTPTPESLFSQALRKPARGSLPPPAPQTLPTPVVSESGTPTGSPLPVSQTNAPPTKRRDDLWLHHDQLLRDLDYHW